MDGRVKEEDLVGHVARMQGKQKDYNNFVGKPRGKELMGKPRNGRLEQY
jgi:hypothetical protein